jgi:hypothetical protein
MVSPCKREQPKKRATSDEADSQVGVLLEEKASRGVGHKGQPCCAELAPLRPSPLDFNLRRVLAGTFPERGAAVHVAFAARWRALGHGRVNALQVLAFVFEFA